MEAGTLNTILLSLVALVTAMTPILLAMINKKQAKALANSEETKVATVEAAAKVEDVKRDLQTQGASVDKQMAEIARVGVDTHTLVNNNMGAQLKLGADLSEFKATTTGKAEDIAAAKLARALYDEHVKKQAIVDSGSRQPPTG